MELIFLGTSSGTPTKQRNVTGLAVLAEVGSWYLVDCGEGTQHQLLRTPLSLHGLRAIFITHVHGDHCYGLPGLLASAAMAGRREPLVVVAPDGIEDWLSATRLRTDLYLPFELQFVASESLETWRDDAMIVQRTALSHRVPSFAYAFTEARPQQSLDIERLQRDGIPRGPLWGRLQQGEQVEHEGRVLRGSDYLRQLHRTRKIVVGGDNDQPALLHAACRDAQVLVHEATYTDDVAAKVGAGVMHSSARMTASAAAAMKVPNLVLTHFSPRYGFDQTQSPSIADLQREAAAVYRGKLFLAEDFARFQLARDGVFTRIS